MKISKKWQSFLFGWREGTLSYLAVLVIAFGGAATLFNGANSYWGIFMSFIYSSSLFVGVRKATELCDKWDRQEYKTLKFVKND